MRFLFVALAAVSLSACVPHRQISSVNVGPQPEAELVNDQGAVLVEVIHAIGPNGPQLDRWTSVKVVSMIEPKKGEEPEVYALERIVNLHSDSAIFAGVLPSGFYRLLTFEGEWRAGSTMHPYGVMLPEKPTEFFVSAGKLNALGVMLQTSISDWTWVYQREPRYDMPALVRELRPQLSALRAPLLLPQALTEKKKEPESNIGRAWPGTPLVVSPEGVGMRGAQFGRVYVRGTDAEWQTVVLDSLQTVTVIVPVAAETAYALDASGRVFRFNPKTREANAVVTPVPARIVSIGHANGSLFAVNERPRADGSVVLQLFRQETDEWREVGAPVSAAHSPHAMLFTDTHFIFTTDGAKDTSRRLTQVALDDGERITVGAPVQLLRRLSDSRLVGASLPARVPSDFHTSSDGGKTWERLSGVKPAGWPSVDADGKLVVPTYRTLNSAGALYIGPPSSNKVTADLGAKFPARCLHFSETGFIQDRLMLFCGERVFQYEDAEHGWRKEALHELQSSLP